MPVRCSLKGMIGLLGALMLFNVDAAAPKLLGLSDMSCQAWKASKSEPEERQKYVTWARGFLSGHNYASPRQQVAEVSSGTIEVYADRYCSEHAKATFADALFQMSDNYSGRGGPPK